MSEKPLDHKKITILACGGTGCNISSKFVSYHGEKNDGFAELNTFFVDTSRSNLKKEIGDDKIFLFKDHAGKLLDGNGKKRNDNYNIISETSTIQDILHKFKPGDLNILIASASGGTGSVASPLLAKELISRGENCIVILIGSTSSRIDLKNTINTLKSYESIASSLGHPINILYRENSSESPRNKVDAEVEQYVYLLSAFFSGQNHGLDMADLRNFLNYNKVTSYAPRLTAIDLFRGNIKIPDDSLAISAVTLTAEHVEVEHEMLVDYQVTGVAHPAALDRIKENMPLHAVIFSGYFQSVIPRLQKLLNEHEEKAKRMGNRTIMASDDKTTSDGLVL